MNLFTEKDVRKLKKDNPNVIDYEDFMKQDKINIPDIDNLIVEINLVLEFMNQDENINLSRPELEQKMVHHFPHFAQNYITLMRMLIDGIELDMLFNLLDTLKKVKKNKLDIKDAETKYGKILAKKFIPSEIYNTPQFQEELNKNIK